MKYQLFSAFFKMNLMVLPPFHPPPPFPHHINYSLYLSAFLKMILTVLPPPPIIRIRRTSHVFLELGMDGTNLCNQT